jgi:hypothetical protein
MKKTLNPLLLFISLMVIISLACSGVAGGEAPASNTDPTAQVPTSAPAPTERPTDIPLPTTVPPTVGPQEFFTEEFGVNSNQDNWYYFSYGSGDEANLRIEQDGEGLTFDLGALDLYLYYIYEPITYKDTKLTIVAENQGVNNNNVSLVCRLDADNENWYEFSFESGGVWYLYAYDDGYNVIDNGGSNELKQGKAVNEYGMTCEGNVITMYINGKMLKSYTDRAYDFSEGQVGFNISSLNVLPVTVNVQSFDIAEP